MKAKHESKLDMRTDKELMKYRQHALVNQKNKFRVREDKSLAYISGYVEGFYNVYETDSIPVPDINEFTKEIKSEYESGKERGGSRC